MQCDTKEKFHSSRKWKLSRLLKEWNFAYMLEKLQSEAITLERLRFLTESDLDQLFQGQKIGEKAEFRFRLMEWKEVKNGYDNIQSCNVVSLNTNQSNFSTNLSSDLSESLIPSSSYDLRTILNEHPTGDYVERTFSEIKKLNDVARKILVDAVITWAITNKIKLTKDIFERISAQIEKDFCEDREVYFRKRGSRSSGRLFDKYYNTLKRLKKTGVWACSDHTNSEDALAIEEGINECRNEAEVRKAYKWLNVFIEPWSEVTNNWRICYSKRRCDILRADDGYNILDVLNKWKHFSHPLGYTLVDIDFSILHPTSDSAVEKWEHFKSKIVPILNERIKDTGNLEYLRNINDNDKGSEQQIMLLLHVLLRPSIKRKLSNIMYRPTIKDSQVSFLLHAVTFNDMQNRLDQLKTSLYNRGETLQPLIIAVGVNICDATFYVYYDEIKYKLPSFLTSLDTCFKIFQVLNLKYPRDSIEVWTFIQRYFYNIKLKEDQISPNILCLINDLKFC